MLFRLLKSKRGVGMEYAIVMMLTVFGFCTVLTTVALLENDLNRKSAEEFSTYVELDRIGEDFIAQGSGYQNTNEKYLAEVTGDAELTLMVYENADGEKGKLLLTVVRGSDGTPRSWYKNSK